MDEAAAGRRRRGRRAAALRCVPGTGNFSGYIDIDVNNDVDQLQQAPGHRRSRHMIDKYVNIDSLETGPTD